MSAKTDELKQYLDETRAYLNSVLDSVGDRWDTSVYSEGAAWNIRELLLHLMNAEPSQLRLMQNIASGQGGVPDDFDLERYNRRIVEKNQEVTVEQARENLRQSRAALLAWIPEVTDEQFAMKGRHGAGHVLSVERIIKVIAGHEQSHAGDIARALGIEVAAE